MPRLVLLNGPPGIGKSTLARLYAERHPLTLALEIDALKYMLGGWLERATQAGLMARQMAIAAARVHLGDGRDVVVPQLLGHVDFILELERLTQQTGAEFVEILLRSTAEDSIARFHRRSAHPEDPSHVQALRLLQHHGDVDQWLLEAHRRLEQVASQRPNTITIDSTDGEIEAAYGALVVALSRSAV